MGIYVDMRNRVKHEKFTISTQNGKCEVEYTLTNEKPYGWAWKLWMVNIETGKKEYLTGFSGTMKGAKEEIEKEISACVRTL